MKKDADVQTSTEKDSLPARSMSSCSHLIAEVPQSPHETPGPALTSCVSVACPHLKRSEHQRTCIQPHLHMPCDIVSSECRKCDCATRSDSQRRSELAHGNRSRRVTPVNDVSSEWFSDELQEDDEDLLSDRTAEEINQGRVQLDSDQRWNGEGHHGRGDVVSDGDLIRHHGTRPRRRNSTEAKNGVSNATGSRMLDENRQAAQSTRKRVSANGDDRATSSTGMVTDSCSDGGHSTNKKAERRARIRSHQDVYSDANSEEDRRQRKSVKHAGRSQRSDQLQGQRSREKPISDSRQEKPELLIPRVASSSPTRTRSDVISRVSFAFSNFDTQII
jgi:hypothetical protein